MNTTSIEGESIPVSTHHYVLGKNPPLQKPGNPPYFMASVDYVPFSRKPSSREFGGICKRLGTCDRWITIPDLYKKTVEEGISWSAGIFDVSATGGSKTNDSWRQQQFFAIDIDNTGPTRLEVDQAHSLCQTYGIEPCIVYETFSSIGENRFRMVFALSTPVTSEPIRNVINRLLLEVFYEADQSTTDAARLLAGGKVGWESYCNPEARLDLENLVNAFHQIVIQRHQESGNYDRYIKNVASALELKVTTRGLLDISFEVEDVSDEVIDLGYVESTLGRTETQLANSTNLQELTKIVWHYRYIISQRNFVNCKATFVFCTVCKSVKTSVKRISTTNKNHTHLSGRPIDLLNNPNWKRLAERCPVYRAFVKDEMRFSHVERFAIALNLKHLRGGLTHFRKIVEQSSFGYDLDKLESMLTSVRKGDYKPATYARYFPEVVTDYPTMYHAALTDYGKIVVVGDRETMMLAEAEQQFSERFHQVLEATQPGVYVLKAPPGLGKTERYLGLQHGVTVAIPRHDLIASVANRYRGRGVEPVILPAFPSGKLPVHIEQDVIRYWSIGAYAQAMECLRYHSMVHQHPELCAYLDAKEAIKYSTKDNILLTTHVNALATDSPHDTIIFDEDILNTVLQTHMVHRSDVHSFGQKVNDELSVNSTKDAEFCELLGQVVRWCHQLLEIDDSDAVVVVPPVEIHCEAHRFRLEAIAYSSGIATKVLSALSANHLLRKGESIHTISFIQPPHCKKVIVLSATADEWLYRTLFKDTLISFDDLGNVQSKGRVVQYHSRSFSRSCLSGMTSLDKYLDQHHPTAGYRITFKKHRNGLCADLHFHATTGLDDYAGRDGVIIGTPHTHTIQHRLVAAVCGHCTGPDDLMMVNQQVERNGLKFWFYTYRGEVLRNIALHLIEAELIQAVGRSRHLRHDVTVTVYSNYPVPGAEYQRLSVEEIEAMMQGSDTQDRETSDDSIESEQVVHSMIFQLIPVGRMIKRHVVSEPLY